jgi:hypothetical protein
MLKIFKTKAVLLLPVETVSFRCQNEATLRVPKFRISKIVARIRILGSVTKIVNPYPAPDPYPTYFNIMLF